MRRALGWIVALPVAALAIVFAVNNNGPVTVDLWPLPWQIDLPMFAIGFAGTLVGFVAGAVVAWISGGKWRKLARDEAREISTLRRGLAETGERAAAASAGSDSGPRADPGGGGKNGA